MTKNIYTIFNIIIIAAIVYVGVDCFYRIVQANLDQPDSNRRVMETMPIEKASPVPTLSDYRIISKRDIFGKSPNGSETDEEAAEIKNLKPTSLKITLMGTVFGDRQNSAAIILDKIKNSQDLYRIGDSVQNGVIKNILRGKVILSYNGRDEILTMDESGSKDNNNASPGAVPPPPTRAMPSRTITVNREDIERSLSNLNEVLSQAAIRPHFSNGNPDGLAFTGVRAGSVFIKMGLRNGDILKSVDGRDIRSPEDLISLYNDLKSAESVSLDIVRRGRERTINYRFR